jgi:flagellar basal body-associated protein FliL
MTFTALLTKELRSRLRRERSIWLIIAYLCVLALLGLVFLVRANAFSAARASTCSARPERSSMPCSPSCSLP